jgi:hypothetical protein
MRLRSVFSSKRSSPLAFQVKVRFLWIPPQSARINPRHGTLVARREASGSRTHDPSTCPGPWAPLALAHGLPNSYPDSPKRMAPRSRPQAIEVECPPNVREGVEQALRGDIADLTAEETERYLETGQLPERVQRWLDEYDSRHAT